MFMLLKCRVLLFRTSKMCIWA